MTDGAFWYTLDDLESKEIPGKLKFVAQVIT